MTARLGLKLFKYANQTIDAVIIHLENVNIHCPINSLYQMPEQVKFESHCPCKHPSLTRFMNDSVPDPARIGSIKSEYFLVQEVARKE